MRVTAVITARPSYSRVKTALEALTARGVAVDVICAASALLERYGRVVDQIKSDGWPVSCVASQVEGDTGVSAARTMALTTMDLATRFDQTKPDAVLTIADRYETLATAVATSYQHIPLVHLQGGEVTGNIDDKVRNAITQLADLHLVSTQQAAENVRRMRPDAEVFVTGCPSLDLAAAVSSAPICSLPGHGADVDLSRPFVLVLQHPVTEEADEAADQIHETMAAVEAVGLPAVWFWPNVDEGSDRVAKALRCWTPKTPVHFVRQVPPDDFVRLMRQCAVMVGNSSAGIREASFLGAFAVNIGDRQRGRERAGNVLDVPPDHRRIWSAIETAWMYRAMPSHLYGDGRAGERIADAITSWLGVKRVAA